MAGLKSLNRLAGCAVALAALAVLIRPAIAHEPGLSTATFKLSGDSLVAEVTFAVADVDSLVTLDHDGDGKITQLEFTYTKPQLLNWASNAVLVLTGNEPAVGTEPLLTLDASNNVDLRRRFKVNPQSPIVIRSLALTNMPANHRQLCVVQGETNQVLVERLLGPKDHVVTLGGAPGPTTGDTPPAGQAHSQVSSFRDFFVLGIQHIWTGYDHVLFLLALLIVTQRIASAVTIITCFTLAHSITLAVATLDLVQMPGRLVEPLIALSIVYVGVENLIRGTHPKGRWLLTFGFGLVHGFGFATVLRELGVGASSGGIWMPLLSFNLGVEIGQLAIACVVLPLLWRFHAKPVFIKRWIPALSLLVTCAGIYWLLERVFGA